MTLAATRRYAFAASVVLGIVATVAASALVTIILSGPEQVIAVLRLL
jgi:hypothetical protein